MNKEKLLRLLSKLQSIFDRIHFYYLEQGQIPTDPIVHFLELNFAMHERYVARALHNSVIAKGTPKIYYVLNSFYHKGKYDSGKHFQHLNRFVDQVVLRCTSTNGCTIDLGEVVKFYCCVIPGTVVIKINISNNFTTQLIQLTDSSNTPGILVDSSGNQSGLIDYGICENTSNTGFLPAKISGVINVLNNSVVTIDVFATTKCLPEKYFDLESVSYTADVFYVNMNNANNNQDDGKIKNVTYTVSLVLNHLIITTSPMYFYVGLVDYSHRLLLVNKVLLRIRKGITVLRPLIINLKSMARLISINNLYGYTNITHFYDTVQELSV